MTNSKFEKYKNEILTFADDIRDVFADPRTGTVNFMRLNQVMSVTILDDPKHDVCIRYNDATLPYRTFLAKYLGYLDVMAKRILEKDPVQDDLMYIDGDATVTTEFEGRQEGTGMALLDWECTRDVYCGSKICFVTANAGHGKTHLLRRYQWQQAHKYQKNTSDFLFLHIDLHGYDLRKLDEVIMYEMAERLHIPGIYTQSILTLMRNGLLILGVDGFDELAVETEGEKAIGSFSNLIRSLDGQGVLIAASRRTFFNTQDYLKHKGLISEVQEVPCYFDELRLQNWKERECVDYLSYRISKQQAKEEYHNIVTYLGHDTNNPLVERPFLFTNIVDYAYGNDTTPYEFLREGTDSEIGLERIITAFIKREVEKWNSNSLTDKATYLSFEQHEAFLAEVASEMWSAQRDFISLDLMEFNLNYLLEQWTIPQILFPDIIKMAKSHAFLVEDSHGSQYRRFDHEEFKNYFLAKSLAMNVSAALTDKNYGPVKKILVQAQMPDSVAQYAALFIPQEQRLQAAQDLMAELRREYKTTYFQQNLGTLLPYLLDKLVLDEPLKIDSKIVFSSIVFENKSLSNLQFDNCTFVNISFNHTKMQQVAFSQCTFTDIRFYDNSDLQFSDVIIHDDCKVAKVSVFDQYGEEKGVEYVPLDILRRLSKNGIQRDTRPDGSEESEEERIYNTVYRKAVKRFLNKFIKCTYQYEKNLKEDRRYNPQYYQLYIDDIIPLMERYGILKSVSNNNTQQVGTRAWALKDYDLTTILQGETDSTSVLHKFWKEVNEHPKVIL